MTLQSLMDQWESLGGWESILANMAKGEWENTTGDEGSTWTEEWVFQVLLAPHLEPVDQRQQRPAQRRNDRVQGARARRCGHAGFSIAIAKVSRGD